MVKKRKYRKQRQHIRKYKSKSKPTVVNSGVFYKTYRTKGYLSQKKRDIFKNLSKKPFETGGYMDFGNNGLQRSTQNYGFRTYTEWEDDPDFEVTYHTHPMFKDKLLDFINHFPSKSDMENFIDTDDQAMTIIHNDALLILTKTNEFKKTNKKKLLKKLDILDKNLIKDVLKYYNKMSINSYVSRAKKLYKKFGLKMTFVPKNKKGSVTFPIRVVEHAKPKKRTFKLFDPSKRHLFKYDVDNLLNLDKDASEGFSITGRDIYNEAVVNKTEPYENLSQIEKIELNLVKGGVSKSNRPNRKVVRGKGKVSKNTVIQETLELFENALSDLANKGDFEGLQQVKDQYMKYKVESGLL